MVPEGGILNVELVGELAGLLSLGQPQNAESQALGLACSTVLVAGACNQLNLLFSTPQLVK